MKAGLFPIKLWFLFSWHSKSYHISRCSHVLFAENHYDENVCKECDGQNDWHDVTINRNSQFWGAIPKKRIVRFDFKSSLLL